MFSRRKTGGHWKWPAQVESDFRTSPAHRGPASRRGGEGCCGALRGTASAWRTRSASAVPLARHDDFQETGCVTAGCAGAAMAETAENAKAIQRATKPLVPVWETIFPGTALVFASGQLES